MTQSILGRVRAEAYSEGFRDASAMSSENAYEAGREHARTVAEAEKRRWGWFCFLSGVGVCALVVALT